MPDHVHLVISPGSQCDVFSFVGQYKGLVLREAWRLGKTGSFWQSSFWDRFIRQDEDLKKAVRYVLHNPVRKGLVNQWQAYPYSGSLVFAREDLE
jgi:REP element-mobilizing transposase RayT